MHNLRIGAVVSVFIALTSIPCITAQDKVSSPSLPAFAAASDKPIEPNVPHRVGIEVSPGGRTVISGLPLKSLVAAAFQLSFWQVSGGDAWMSEDSYIVEATPGEESRIINLRYSNFTIEDEHLRQMLQALLIDRFKLKYHRETRTGDVYLLERNDKPLKLRSMEALTQAGSKGPLPNPSFSSIGYAAEKWRVWASSMPQFAKFAGDSILHAPVLDRTGLAGSFEYWQEVPDLDPNYKDPTDSFLRFTHDLGFNLKRSEGPIETLVIESAVKPTPN